MKKAILLSQLLFLISLLALSKDSFSQNVGIGVANPTRAKLEVNGAVDYTAAIFGGESTGIGIIRNNPAIGFNNYYNNGNRYIANGYSGTILLDAINGAMFFDINGYGTANSIATTGVNSMIIGSSGNVSIRAYPVNATLYTLKAGNVNGSAVFGGTNYNSHFDYGTLQDTYIRGGKGGSKVIINDIPDGKILIGNGSSLVCINNFIPVYPLEIRQAGGHGLIMVEPNNSFNNWELKVGPGYNPNEDDLKFIYNGQLKGAIDFGGAYFTYSDKRLKTNIQAMPSLLDRFMQLEPVEYEMKDHNVGHKRTMGFIAQDVQKLFPELVTVTNGRHGYAGIDGLYGLSYNGFRILAIKALQEQQEKIKMMQKQNAELAKRIAAAEKLVAIKKL